MRIFLICCVVLFGVAEAFAQDFSQLPYTNFRTLEGVDSSGLPTYAASGFPLKLRGIILNTPAAMSNSTPNFTVQPFNVSTYWQVFVQSVDVNNNGDNGGTALYMAQNYGNIPPNLTFPGGVPTSDASASYTNTEWQAQLNRLNGYQQNTSGSLPTNGYQLQAGDLVEVRARGGLFFGGKYNVNEEHSKTFDYAADPGLSFDVIYIGHPGLPTPAQLLIADLWDTSTNSVRFDTTRNLGGERYQGEYVSLNQVQLVSGEELKWMANQLVKVQDSAGRQMTLQLGTNSLFAPANAPSGWFNATGIFNQEAGSGGPFTSGYQLWVMDPTAVVAIPEPNTIALALTGMVVIWRVRMRGRQGAGA